MTKQLDSYSLPQATTKHFAKYREPGLEQCRTSVKAVWRRDQHPHPCGSRHSGEQRRRGGEEERSSDSAEEKRGTPPPTACAFVKKY
jgi:hypothetical protein